MKHNAQRVKPTPPEPHDDTINLFSTARPWDSRILKIAFGVALLFHGLAVLIRLPSNDAEEPSPIPSRPLYVKKYVPPPPRIERPRVARVPEARTRKIPVPDPTPDAPEPVVEPGPAGEFVPALPGVEFLLGDPTPPTGDDYGSGAGGGGAGPVLAGVGGVTNPVRIEESYVRPEYPPLARAARIEGEVILKAVILTSGAVTNPEVLRCTQPGFGFEQEAIEAVSRWRFVPATQAGRPVDVYFTIIVDFEIV
jgi:protein TonB